MNFLRLVEASGWLLAVCLLAAAVVWPGWSVQSARDTARLAAKSALDRVAAQEHRLRAERGRFVGFGSRGAEREEVLAEMESGPDDHLFDMNALLDEAGNLHLVVVSRPEMIRQGAVAPVMEEVELVPPVPSRGE